MAPSTPLKPQFFVWRPDGKQVPLIAMDEVPTNVIFHGVPRTLDARDTVGMTSVGERSSRHMHYRVDFAGSRASPFEGLSDLSRAFSPDPTIFDSAIAAPATSPQHTSVGILPRERSLLDNPLDSTFEPQAERHQPAKKYIPPTHRSVLPSKHTLTGRSFHASVWASLDHTDDDGYAARPLAFSIQSQPPSGATVLEPDHAVPFHVGHEATPGVNGMVSNGVEDVRDSNPGLGYHSSTFTSQDRSCQPLGKEYCNYWMRHGECDYVQQGCKFKHEFPSDREKLAALGFRDYPEWYRMQHKLPSLLAVPGSGAAGGPANIAKKQMMDSDWRANATNNGIGKGSPVGGNQGPFTKAERLPTRPASSPRPLNAYQSRPSTCYRNSAGAGAKNNRKPALSLDEIAAINAIKQMQKSDAEEAQRKANVSARVSKRTKPTANNAMLSSGGTDATSRCDADSPVPTNSIESEADTDQRRNRQTMKPGSGKAKRRSSRTRKFSKRPNSPEGTRQNGKARSRKTSDDEEEVSNAGDEAEGRSVINFRVRSDSKMPVWTPDCYDHDD